MKNLAYYGWLFTFNPYTDRWNATTSDHKEELFSGGKHVVHAREIDSIETMIIKHDGKLDEILKHIKTLD